MTIRLRLIVLLGCLLAVFALATLGLRQTQQSEAEHMRTAVVRQRGVLVDGVLQLTGQQLRNFVSDYAQWDEMLAFVGSGDPAWARINLDASLPNFGASAAWVLRLDGSTVYQTGGTAPSIGQVLPVGDPAFSKKMAREKYLHFFLESPAGLIEVRTAPILPSADIQRTGPARGWFVVARLWTNETLRALGDTLQSQVGFTAPPANFSPVEVDLQRGLNDWTGKRLRTLHILNQSVALTQLYEGNERETLVLFALGLTMIGVTTVGVSRWVLGPLRRLGQSLESGRPDPLQDLPREQNEFGHLARLVQQSFSQRAALEHEVRERSRMAAELQETSSRLGESLELRGRLARDLHDGVIQSIYAAGLGLEGVRSSLQTDPTAADQRLQACVTALNGTIRDVRTFINALEPEASALRPFHQTLSTLIATLQSIQPGNITTDLDEALARRIGPAQESHLLQILRESIGNALRHADARTIHVTLRTGLETGAELSIADDGCGFDPARPAGQGRGLTNLGIRAREMGGTMQIDSTPGKGTRVTLCFTPTYPP